MRTHKITTAVVLMGLIVGGVVGVAEPAAAAPTVNSVSELEGAFIAADESQSTIIIGSSISAPGVAVTLPGDGNVILDLDGNDLTLGNLVLGVGANLIITDAAGGGTVDITSPPDNTTAIRTTGATLRIEGDANVTAIGGTLAAGVGGVGSPTEDGGDGGTVTVSGTAQLFAEGGYPASGVGGGANGDAGLADGGTSGAAGTLSITGSASVIAYGLVAVGGFDPANGGEVSIGDDATLQVGWASGDTTIPLGEKVTDNGVLQLTDGLNNDGEISGHGFIEGLKTIQNLGSIYRSVDVDTTVAQHNYPVKFFANDGTASFSTVHAYGLTLNDIGAGLPSPVRTGYFFGGWNTLPDGTGSAFTQSTILSAVHVVYAKWLSTTSSVKVSGSAFKKHAHPKVKVTVGKLNTGGYPQGVVAISIAGVPVATGVLTLANKGVISITLPAQTKTIKVQATYEGDATTGPRSSSIVTITAK